MQAQSRIPKLHDTTFDSALRWFSELQCNGLLFHPEDDPATIVEIANGIPVFTDTEVQELHFLIRELEEKLGHENMIDAAYPIFMKAAGVQLDA